MSHRLARVLYHTTATTIIITTMTTTPPAMAATMIMLISSSSSSTTLSAVPTVLIFGLLEVILPAVVVAGALVVEFDVVSGTNQA